MMKNLLTLLTLLLVSFSTYAQITSVGILGTAAGGWDVDTNLVQDMNDPNLWTISLELTDGVAKFRADDSWDVNWGATDFPTAQVALPPVRVRRQRQVWSPFLWERKH